LSTGAIVAIAVGGGVALLAAGYGVLAYSSHFWPFAKHIAEEHVIDAVNDHALEIVGESAAVGVELAHL
jgi:hypothetical protein